MLVVVSIGCDLLVVFVGVPMSLVCYFGVVCLAIVLVVDFRFASRRLCVGVLWFGFSVLVVAFGFLWFAVCVGLTLVWVWLWLLGLLALRALVLVGLVV